MQLPFEAAGQYQACGFAEKDQYSFEQTCPCTLCCFRRVAGGYPIVPAQWGLFAKEPLLSIKPDCLCHGLPGLSRAIATQTDPVDLVCKPAGAEATVQTDPVMTASVGLQIGKTMADEEVQSECSEIPLPTWEEALELPAATINIQKEEGGQGLGQGPSKAMLRRKRRKKLEESKGEEPLKPFVRREE